MPFIKRAVVEDIEFVTDLNSLDSKEDSTINPIKKNLDYVDSILSKETKGEEGQK
jgi:hypothetical protein